MPALSFPLAGPLGDGTTQGPAPVGHIATAMSLLIEQYKGKPVLGGLLAVIATETQALLDAANQLNTLASIDDSEGVQLDVIGARLGEARQGFDDVSYRLHLKARIRLNRSSGTIEDVVGLFAALLGPGPSVTLQEYAPAAIWVFLEGLAVDATLAPYLVNFLRSVKVGGVRALLQWSEHDASETFAFAGAPGIGFDSGWWSSAE